MTEKIDLKRTLDAYQARADEVRVVEVPDQQYLAVDGHGDPNTASEYTAALESLYPVAYALKMASKRELGCDYVVPPLEGLWWADDLAAFTTARDKTQWDWTMLLLVPDWLDAGAVDRAIEWTAAKPEPPAHLEDVRLKLLSEGTCVQTLHVGPYDDEAPVLARLHDEVIPGLGMRPTGTHHEIYLGDPRRAAPEKLRTILRQPVRRA